MNNGSAVGSPLGVRGGLGGARSSEGKMNQCVLIYCIMK
jgi:hypothetical protein